MLKESLAGYKFSVLASINLHFSQWMVSLEIDLPMGTRKTWSLGFVTYSDIYMYVIGRTGDSKSGKKVYSS